MLSLICGFKVNEPLVAQTSTTTATTTTSFVEHKYYRYLNNYEYEFILNDSSLYLNLKNVLLNYNNSTENEEVKAVNLSELIRNEIENCDKYELFSISISCLQLFVKYNWLGPSDKTEIVDDYKTFKSLLELDGESLTLSATNLYLIYLARLFLIDFVDLFGSMELIDWWKLRLLYVYQQLFEEKCATLTNYTLDSIKNLNKYIEDAKLDKLGLLCYYIEIGFIHYQIYNWNMGEESFENALKCSGLDLKLTGVSGRRTKYQQIDIAQLILKIHKLDDYNNNREKHESSNIDPQLLPKNVALNDDTVLDSLKLKDTTDSSKTDLTQLEQAVVYCILYNTQKNSPNDVLRNEEMSTFIDYLLSNPKNWCIQTCCLTTRAKIESKSSRRIERSLFQLETLVEFFDHPKPESKYRYNFFYSVNFLPIWQLKFELAKLYMELGCINSALDIYLKLSSWENIVRCYITLEKREKAENIIREQLSIKETPELYCLLGEATRDPSFFEKAIELSNGKSTKAYRMLAKYYFSRENYEDAIKNFEKSLNINSMQYDAWFMLGNAGFRSQKWDIAIKAFRRCTNLEPDNHETWNNLAASYLKINEKSKAHAVFQEALKFDYENWKIWENFLWTSTDCGYFDDVIKSYHRLLDLKEKYTDIDVLKALYTAIKQNFTCPNTQQSILNSKKRILELFGRIVSVVVNEAKIYWYYGNIVFEFGKLDDNDFSKTIEISDENANKGFTLIQKCLRSLINQQNWDQVTELCREIIEYSINIIKLCMEYGPFLKSPNETFGSFKLNIKSIINKMKQKYSSQQAQSSDGHFQLEYLPELNDLFIQLQVSYDEFVKKYYTN